jgi:hypothetical protein
MEELRALLALTGASELARVGRAGVIGLRAGLTDALEEARDDPGMATCGEVLAALDELLGSPAAVVGARSPAPVVDPVPDAFALLVREIVDDPAVRRHLSVRDLDAAGRSAEAPAAAWQRLQMAMLRVPAGAAGRWRERLGDAAPGPGDVWVDWPDDCDDVLVPSTTWWTGIRTSQAAEPDGDVVAALLAGGGRPPPAGGALLARQVSLALAVAGVDSELNLALERVQRRGLSLLDDTGLAGWKRETCRRLTAYASAVGPEEAVSALVQIDEAMHSLLHLPVAAADSWWAHLGGRVRALVDAEVERLRKAGNDVEVVPLSLRYREVIGQTGGNDLALDGGPGAAGDVVVCLRMWSRIGGKERPGRVAYRL